MNYPVTVRNEQIFRITSRVCIPDPTEPESFRVVLLLETNQEDGTYRSEIIGVLETGKSARRKGWHA